MGLMLKFLTNASMSFVCLRTYITLTISLLLCQNNNALSLKSIDKFFDNEDTPISFVQAGESTFLNGYIDVTNFEDKFIAVGSDGRIDWISASGEIIKSVKIPDVELNCISTFDKHIITAGDNGIIFISSDDDTFRKLDSGTDKNINAITLFKGKIVACGDNGQILLGDKKGLFRKIQLNLKGNIVSVSSRASDCYGVTDEGEIIYTNDGISWDVFDFNKNYSGYYKPCQFSCVLATENRIAVIGIYIDGSPVLMFSSRGKVWTERTLNYTDDEGKIFFLKEIPNDIIYLISKDQFIITCSEGRVITIPSCSHCNKLYVLSSENLKGISANENSLLIVGDKDYIKTINMEFF